MSESPPAVPEIVPPRRRQRWIGGLLLILLVGGGVYGWRNCQTPDEQFFVGRWELSYTSDKGQVDEHMIEFRSHRTAYSTGQQYRWNANHEQIRAWEIYPIRDLVQGLFQNGFESLNNDEVESIEYEFIAQDKFVPRPQSGGTAEWRRIVEK